jgi:LysR family transcriptional regulator, transcription activator of glutamate synthase operon
MELFQIDYFRALARTGNVTAAASELHITQPALSRAISALETDLDTQLFERERGKLHLNRAGELFLENADKIFAEIANARERLEALKKPEAETLRFGTTQHGLITRALYAFCAERPELHVEEERLPAREIKNYCETSGADFVFSPESAHSPVIEVWKLYTDGFVLLGGENGAEIPVEEIRDMRIIQVENYHRLDAVYASPNFSENLCFDCGDVALALGLVRSGFGVTVLSRDYYRFLSESSPGMTEGINCAVVTKNGLPLTYDVLCSRQRYREMSAAAGEFADFLKQFYALAMTE